MQSGCLLTLLGFPYGNGATCGAWGSSRPPLTPLPPSPLQNMPNVRDHDASVYLRLQGDALSVGGYESNPIFWEEVSTPRGGGTRLCKEPTASGWVQKGAPRVPAHIKPILWAPTSQLVGRAGLSIPCAHPAGGTRHTGVRGDEEDE